MAELFSYTSQQNVVTPSSPTIQVQPNTQAADSFKNLTTLLTAAQQEQQNKVQREKAMVSAELKYNNAVRVKQEREAADIKEQQKLIDNQDFLNRSKELNVYQQEAELARTNAGNNEAEQLEILTQFQVDTDVLFNTASPAVKLKLNSQVNQFKRSATNEYSSVVQKNKKDNFNSSYIQAMGSILVQPVNEIQDIYASLQQQAVSSGISKKEFGTDFVSNSINFIVSRLDEEQLINNQDYNSLTQAFNLIDNVSQVDGKNVEAINTANKTLTTLKNKVDASLRNVVVSARETGDNEIFRDALTKGRDNGVYTDDQVTLELQKYVQKQNDSTTLIKNKVSNDIQATGGKLYLGNLTGKEKTEAKSSVQELLTLELFNKNASNTDRSLLKYHADYNTSVYRPIWKEKVNKTFQEIKQAAIDPASATKSMAEYMSDLDRISSLSFGLAETENANVKIALLKTMVVQGNIKNIPEAFRVIDTAPDDILQDTSSKQVRALREDDGIPKDKQREAYYSYSALVATGQLDKDEAYEIVKNQYKFNDVEGSNTQYSTGALSVINKSGLAVPEVQYLESVLTATGDTQLLPDANREKLEGVFNGTNPTIIEFQGNLLVRNEEGASEIILMKGDVGKAITDATHTASDVANTPEGVEITVAEASESLSTGINSLFEGLGNIAYAAVTPVNALLASGIRNVTEVLYDPLVASSSHLNELYHNLAYSDMTREEAIDLYNSQYTDDMDKVVKENNLDSKAWAERVKQNRDSAKDTIDDVIEGQLGVFKWVSEGLTNAIVGKKSYEADLPNLASTEGFGGQADPSSKEALAPVVQKEPSTSEVKAVTLKNEASVNTIFNHLTSAETTTAHVGADTENLTLGYGIVPDKVTVNGKVVKAKNNTLTDAWVKQNEDKIDYTSIVKRFAGKTFKSKDYNNYTDFVKSVLDHGLDTVKSSVSSSLPSEYYQTFLSSIWNGGEKSLNWSGFKTTIQELSKPQNEWDMVNIVDMGKHSFTTGKPSVGLLKRRMEDLNLTLPEDKKLSSVSQLTVLNKEGKFDHVELSVYGSDKKLITTFTSEKKSINDDQTIQLQ